MNDGKINYKSNFFIEIWVTRTPWMVVEEHIYRDEEEARLCRLVGPDKINPVTI